MARDAAEIVRGWRERRPPTVPKEDVITVVEAYFPGYCEYSDRGSHFLIVSHPALRLASEHGYSANFPQGRLSLSHSKGKEVKGYLIRHLLEAIDIKDTYDRAV